MARPLRMEFAAAVYQPTSRGNVRQKFFFSDADRELVLDTLSQVNSRYGWICYAYFLLAKHYHKLVETPRGTLSIGMCQLNGICTQSVNRRRVAPAAWKWSSYRATAGQAKVSAELL